MNLNEEYGFDAFCAQLVAQWPEVGLTLRRKENRVFATASALGQTAIALSRDNELAGSTVRRAVVELHARLVAAAGTPAAPVAGEDARVARLNAINTRLDEIDVLVESITDSLAEVAETIADFARGDIGLDAEDMQALTEKLNELHTQASALTVERETLEDEAEALVGNQQ